MHLCQTLLASAAAFAGLVNAGRIASPHVEARVEGLSLNNRLDLAYQEASIVLGTDKVGKNVPLVEGGAEPNWSNTCLFVPYILIEPESTADVSTTVRIINKYDIKFAVFAGGHSVTPGASSITKGVLIHLGRLNQATLSGDGKIARVGPGGRWQQVANDLAEQGATVSGARAPVVGVGGLLLGGGLHHTLAEYGMAADNVRNFEVVLGDGSVVNANKRQNSDLFWALKGGGPNFGIVTRFDLEVLPIDKVWYQQVAYSLDDRDAIFKAFVKWQVKGSADLKSTATLLSTLDAIIILYTYSAPVEFPDAFGDLLDLEPVSYVIPPTIGTYAMLTEALVGWGPGQRHEMGTASFEPDLETYLEVYGFWHERALEMRERINSNQTFILQPISYNAAAVSESKGGNPLGLPAVDHTWWTTVVDWDHAKDDDIARSVSKDTIEYWTKLSKERGIYVQFDYMNDCTRDQNPLASYGEKNLKKLKKIASKYDPKGFFQKKQNGGFLLSRA